jgi:ABC-2 type transport system ATP-binding protein
VRVHAVEPVRISLEERLLGILRHDEPNSAVPDHAEAGR